MSRSCLALRSHVPISLLDQPLDDYSAPLATASQT